MSAQGSPVSRAGLPLRDARGRGERGFVLMAVLIALMLTGLALVTYTQSWWAARQRDREAELLFVGQQYRQALESYYLASPGAVKHLPVQLEDLVLDRRFPQPVRHLRRLYADPLAPDTPWGLIRRGPQIMGLYSQANGEPFKRADFDLGLENFTGARSYAQWQFMFVPRANAPTPGRSAPAITAAHEGGRLSVTPAMSRDLP